MGFKLAVALLLVSSVAYAQPKPTPTSTSTMAEAMFLRGRELLAAGNIAEACAAFDESQKLEHALSTLMNQANCRERNNQLATAWGLFQQAEQEAGQHSDPASAQMKAAATARLAKLAPRLSKIRIAVSAESRVPDLAITRDAAVVDPSQWDAEQPVDGGTYTIVARAPGVPEWKVTVTVGPEADVKTIEVPRLAPVVVEKPLEVKKEVPPHEHHDVLSPSMWTPKRKLAIGLAAGGGVAIVVGAILGASAKSAQDDVHALCPDPDVACADAARANDLSSKAHTRGIVANVGFGVGAAALIAGGVLWFVGAPESPNGVAIAPMTSPDLVGLSASGRF